MHVFGLTGGIASGKSTVAARLRERGVPVVDADELAREVVAKGTAGLAAIVEHFGPTVLMADGSLDRAKLGELVFADVTKRKVLGAITHPLIAAASATRTRELAGLGHPLACYEAALLVENGLADAFRPLVVVASDEALQISRAVARDHTAPEAAAARVRAQLPLARKVAAADIVIHNDGTLDQLRRRTDDALDAVCATLRVDAARFPRT